MQKIQRPAAVTEAIAVVACVALGVSACSAVGRGEKLVTNEITTVPPADIDLDVARAENHNRLFDPRFENRVEVVSDPSGIASTRMFFPDSGSLIISSAEDAALLRSASIAICQHVPMVVFDPAHRKDIERLAADLGVERILLVGEVAWAESDGDRMVFHDPGDKKSLGQYTAFSFHTKVVADRHRMAREVARLYGDEKIELKATWQPLEVETNHPKMPAIPAQSRRDGQMAPNIVATAESPIANIVNAESYGGEVLIMPAADPRQDIVAHAMVAGLDNGPLVALGPEFGSVAQLREHIKQADVESQKQQERKEDLHG